MNLIDYFERQKQRCERELKYAAESGFQLFEKTVQGEHDITAQHIKELREARDEYQRIIEDLQDRGLKPLRCRCGGGRSASGLLLVSCRHFVEQLQPAGLFQRMVAGSRATALEHSVGRSRGIGQGGLDGVAEVKLSIAVRVGTGKFEKGARRRKQQM